jgi:hypothetical protein
LFDGGVVRPKKGSFSPGIEHEDRRLKTVISQAIDKRIRKLRCCISLYEGRNKFVDINFDLKILNTQTAIVEGVNNIRKHDAQIFDKTFGFFEVQLSLKRARLR